MHTVARPRRLGIKGIAAVEFALVAPLFILMLMGVAEETALLRAQLKLSHAAGLLGKMVAQQNTAVSSGVSGTLGNLCSGVALTMTPLSTTGFSSATASVTKSASGTTAMDWESDNSCNTPATAIGAAGAVSLATASGLLPDPGDSLIVVKAGYAYTATTHFFLAANYTLTQTIYARPRINTAIVCSNCGG